MSPLTFKQFIIEGREGDRVGIQHLYHPTKSHLSMNFFTFKEVVEYLKQHNGILHSENANLSEKADGIALKFGVLPDHKFFMQSSYSGVVTDPNEFETRIKYEPVKRAFKENFYKLQELVASAFENNKNGITIQAEWLYSPLALERENKPGAVYFVATDYDITKLGTWSTFVIINVSDSNGKPINHVLPKLLKLTNKEVKFLPAGIDVFPDINLRMETVNALNVISDLYRQYPDLDNTLKSKSLKHVDVRARKELSAYIINQLTPVQAAMYQKLLDTASTVAGRLGEFEGIVVKIGNLLFKVNTPEFFKNKEERDAKL
jgi:hypothetical protein